jgi:uncharacterized membrane protein
MDRRPLISAGIILGAGLGGLLDGITLHQILQTHNMLSAVRPRTTLVNAEVNMFWDGLFHAFTWIVIAIGLARLWRAGARPDVPWSGRTFSGALLAGWGIFNLVEGLIDHHILGIHHVVERLGVSVFDYAFLASGVVFILGGSAIIKSGAGDTAPRGARPMATLAPR